MSEAVQTMVWERDSSVMVYIPAGEFIMGSSDAQVDSTLTRQTMPNTRWFS
jgi:hypothetical protein